MLLTNVQTRKIEPDITVVAISGRLNLGDTLKSIESSVRHLIDAGARKMIVDLAGLSAVDSSGLGMLLGCFTHMEQSGGSLRIAGATGGVSKVFVASHIERIVPLDADVESARNGFGT